MSEEDEWICFSNKYFGTNRNKHCGGVFHVKYTQTQGCRISKKYFFNKTKLTKANKRLYEIYIKQNVADDFSIPCVTVRDKKTKSI